MKILFGVMAARDGEIPGRSTRRWRALAMALSAVSLGLGFLWCLLDEDTLCWHDRITRTYLSAGAVRTPGNSGPVFVHQTGRRCRLNCRFAPSPGCRHC